jgi:hypothetical protein
MTLKCGYSKTKVKAAVTRWAQAKKAKKAK